MAEATAAVVALDGVSLTLAKGSVTALLGPSGFGQVHPHQGPRLRLAGGARARSCSRVRPVVRDGVPLADLSKLRRQHLGFVFQKANLTSFLTALENVEIACELGGKGQGRKRARELLAYLEVDHREDSYPEMLSGGEQQRVAIARALANEPSLILADEPTAALDSVRSRIVMDLFRRVAHEQGAAVLVVTHDHRALDVFDLLYEMDDGRLRPAAGHAPALSPVVPPPGDPV
jgi:putative ABC transport system ATP-binding protein